MNTKATDSTTARFGLVTRGRWGGGGGGGKGETFATLIPHHINKLNFPLCNVRTVRTVSPVTA